MRRTSLLSSLLLLLAALSACTRPEPVEDRITRAYAIAHSGGLEPHKLRTARFDIMSFRHIADPTAPVRIYIEGDGFAWANRNQPARNPTPHRPLALELAAIDPHLNRIYLARPCQYFTAPRGCRKEFWTHARFSPAVLEAMNDALEMSLQDASLTMPPQLELIGYSGGGTLTLLLAEKRQDVTNIRTVAGNLDPAGWTRHHNISPLKGSLLPRSDTPALRRIPQLHFSGEKDDIMPPQLIQRYVESLPTPHCTRHASLPGLTHHEGWKEAWPRFLAMPFSKECIN